MSTTYECGYHIYGHNSSEIMDIYLYLAALAHIHLLTPAELDEKYRFLQIELCSHTVLLMGERPELTVSFTARYR